MANIKVPKSMRTPGIVPTIKELECITSDPYFKPYEKADEAEQIILNSLNGFTPEAFDYLFNLCCMRLNSFTGKGYSMFQQGIFLEYLRRVKVANRRRKRDEIKKKDWEAIRKHANEAYEKLCSTTIRIPKLTEDEFSTLQDFQKRRYEKYI